MGAVTVVHETSGESPINRSRWTKCSLVEKAFDRLSGRAVGDSHVGRRTIETQLLDDDNDNAEQHSIFLS